MNHRRLRSFDLTPEREARNAHVIPVTVVFKGQETMLCPVHLSLSLRHHAHGPLAKRLINMAHLSGNTSGVSKSSSDWLNYKEFPGDVCVAFFNILPRNKEAVTPNPLTKEDAGFSKVKFAG